MKLDSQQIHKNPASFLVIGPGAVGLTIGARLNMLGFTPRFLQKIQNQAVQTKQFFGWNESPVFEIGSITHDEWQHFDMVFCAVKAFQLDEVLRDHLPKLRPGCVIAAVANGAILSIVERYQTAFPRFVLRTGYCMFGTTMTDAGTYKLTSESSRLFWGPTVKGKDMVPLAVETNLIARDSGEFFNFSPNVQTGFMQKWIFNTVMNSICCSRGYSKNKQLLENQAFLGAVFAEAFLLHEKLWPQSPLKFPDVWKDLVDFINKTGENENSMFRDKSTGNRTESDFLAGMSAKYDGFPVLKSLHAQCATNFSG